MLRYLVEDGKTEGIVVGLLEADGSTRVLSFGNAGPGAPPLGPRSVFATGSIGKTFTATLLADMVMRGDVALEDPVSYHLPDSVTVPSYGGREITLLDLATHRSGFPKNADNHEPADPENPYADFTIETMYEFLSGHELRREPGAQFEYSNLGFQLLGHALGRAAGMSYTDLHRERILTPLGMTNAGFTLEGERAEWVAKGHRNGSVVPIWTGTEARLGAGGLFAHVEDMLQYLKANVGPPRTELEEAMQMAHEARLPWGESGARIGLAWKVDSIQGRPIVQHGGNTNGFSAFIGFDPEKRVGLVWLTNIYVFADGTPLELLAHGRRPAVREVRVAPGALAGFVGEYRDPSGSSLYVRLEDEGYLTIQSPRRARFRMYAESETSFTLDRGSARLIFERAEEGEILGVRMEPSQSGEIARKVGDDSPTPRAVAAGDEWQRIGIEWNDGYWVLLGGLALLCMLTLGAELRRVSGTRRSRGS
ncbi:serine hydrolase [Gemmatimonadota bacterium]